MTEGHLDIAVAQLSSSAVVAENLETIAALVGEAAARGARWVSFPENAPQLAPDVRRVAEAEGLDGPQIEAVRALARRWSLWIHLGSFAERTDDPRRTANTSVVIGPDGRIVATYRKIHLFDVQVAADTTFRESDSVVAGPPTPVCVEIDGWNVGLSICYDLRFPELYRALTEAGAEVLMVPAAFTQRTGAAHWHPLLRARAIENQCYVVAAAQVGPHYGARESYGHTLVVGPWGEVIAQRERGVGLVMCRLERSAVAAARQQIPCREHRRL